MESVAVYPRSRWLVMFTVFFAYFGQVGMMMVAFSPLVGVVAQELNITPGEMSFFAMGLYPIVLALSVIASGALIDRFGLKPVFFIGSAITLTGALLVYPLTHSVAGIIALRLIVGIGGGPAIASLAPSSARWFPVNERGLCTGVAGSAMPVGIAAAFFIQGEMLGVAHGDWRAVLMALSVGPAISMIFVVLMMFFAKESSLPRVAAFSFGDSSEGDFAHVVRLPAFYVVIAAMTCYNFAMTAFTNLTPGYIAIAPPMGLGRGPSVAGSLMSLNQLGNFVGGICSGIIADKILKGNVRPMIAATFLILAATTLSVKFPFFNNSGLLFGASLFLVGFSLFSIITVLTIWISTNIPVSLVARVYSIGFGVSLIVGGGFGVSACSTVLHLTGSYQVPIMMVSIVALGGFFLALFLRRPKGSHQQRNRTWDRAEHHVKWRSILAESYETMGDRRKITRRGRTG